MKDHAGFFDLEERYAAPSQAGDPLERLVQVVDFEVFRHQLRATLRRSERDQGGRPPYDLVLMFKILVLQEPLSRQHLLRTPVAQPKI